MKKSEFSMEDIKNKAKANKLKDLIRMMGKEFLGEFEEHEKDEDKLSDKIMKSGVDEKPKGTMVEIEIESSPMKEGNMKKDDKVLKTDKKQFKSEVKEAGGDPQYEDREDDEEEEEDREKMMRAEELKKKFMDMGLDESEAQDLVEKRMSLMKDHGPQLSKNTKFVTIQKGIGKGLSVGDLLGKKMDKKYKK